MIPIVLVVLMILFFARVYYYDLVKRGKTNLFFSMARKYFSPKYLLPLEIEEKDSKVDIKNKKIGNKLLYAFYILLLLILLGVTVLSLIEASKQQ